jgi:hypothetical protein
LPWKRYELENYVVNPDLLIEWVRQERADLFIDQGKEILDQLILDQIFDGNMADFNNYSQANLSMLSADSEN